MQLICDKTILVRAKGIEPSSKAWEAFVLPLYHTRNEQDATKIYGECPELNYLWYCF